MRIRLLAVALLAAATVLTACGSGDSTDAGNAGGGGGGGDLSVAVVEPASGAKVATPFQVRVDSSVPLGPSESGQHHVHIWFDDNDDDYVVVEADTTQVTEVSPGDHTMHVSLRNANHSATGVEATVPITVGGGGQPAGSPDSAGDGPGPGGY